MSPWSISPPKMPQMAPSSWILVYFTVFLFFVVILCSMSMKFHSPPPVYSPRAFSPHWFW